MSVSELSEEQKDELRWRLFWCNTDEDFEAVGAYTDELTDDEWTQIESGFISDEVLEKCFGDYCFVEDDFFCSCGEVAA